MRGLNFRHAVLPSTLPLLIYLSKVHVLILAIAIGILIASKQLKTPLSDFELIGELTLSGQLRAVNGVLPHTMSTR